MSSLRARRAVFWYLACDRIVAAVVSRAEREPVLESCAASYASAVSGSFFAPGMLEIAWVLGCEKDAHVAALASSFCRVEAAGDACPEVAGEDDDEPAVETVRGERLAALSGSKDAVRIWARENAVAQAAALFRRARLNLVALDCEPCALTSLADALGARDGDGARRQHLSAVTVLPDCEGAAEAIGDDLAVPVGLAVAWLGVHRAR